MDACLHTEVMKMIIEHAAQPHCYTRWCRRGKQKERKQEGRSQENTRLYENLKQARMDREGKED